MKRILCAIDYSKNAITALKYAYEISEEISANLLVVHVFDYPNTFKKKLVKRLPYIEEDFFREEKLKLKEFCIRHLGNELDEMNINMEAFEASSIVRGIISKADEVHAFMIVAGMKGNSALKDLIIGNTTKQLIEKANCLVMAVPEHFTHTQLKTIVYATDFEEDEDIEVIQEVLKIAEPYNATLKIVHISTEKEHAEKNKMGLFKKTLLKKIDYEKIEFKVLFSNAVFDSLNTYLEEVGANLLVILERKKHGLLKKWFHKDLIGKHQYSDKIPLLSFNKSNFGMLHFLKLE
jgi:nucleotide-binding universal stress UspA family protein